MNEQCIRDSLVGVIKRLNSERCRGRARFNYPYHSPDGEYRMPPSHWEPARPNPQKPGQSDWMDFHTREGIRPSEAIDFLFHGPFCPILLECLTATYLVYYEALMLCSGPQAFDSMFRGGIRIAPNRSPIQRFLTVECRTSPLELRRGDWVYFYNHPDYLNRHRNTRGNAWQGENAFVMGPDSYEGFGVSERSAAQLVGELFREYNKKPNRFDPASGRYVPDVERDRAYPELTGIHEIPGLIAPRGSCKGKIGPVIIPNMEALS